MGSDSDLDASPEAAEEGAPIEERAPDERAPTQDGALAAWLTPAGFAGLVALAGAGYFAITRVYAASFYHSLGVPVGLLETGYPELLVQAGGVIAVAATYATLAFGFLYVVARWAWWAANKLAARLRKKGLRGCLAWAVAVGVAIFLTVFSIVTWPLGQLILAAAGTVMLGWLYTRFPLFAAITLLVGGGFLLAGNLDAAARDDLADVRSGRVPDVGISRFGLEIPAFPWRLHAGSVRWIDAVPRALKSVRFKCVIVLAVTDQGTVVYTTDVSGVRQALTVPAEAAFVQVYPDRKRCSGLGWSSFVTPPRSP